MYREAISPAQISAAPTLSGTTPTFLGSQRVELETLTKGAEVDAIIVGLPWEGTNTWGEYSGCEQTPKACRYASLRYGSGYVPEYDVDIAQKLRLGDAGDLPVDPTDVEKTFSTFEAWAGRIFDSGVTPIFLGGDHSVSYPIVKALAQRHPGRVGILHFDAHLDNADAYDGDRLARCCPLRRIAEAPGIDPTKIVHMGIHGPRNSPSQMRFARECGATVITVAEIRSQGLEASLERALGVISRDTDGIYVTVCSDIIDHAFNPGGPLDFGGLTAWEMLSTLYRLAQGPKPLLGLDLVEVYPHSDLNGSSVHLMVWLATYALAGLANRRG